MSAFRLAVQMGYGIELDVRLTRDNRLVVFHDESLKRMCGCEDLISEKTYEELFDYFLLDTDDMIPSLEDVLAMVDGRVPLLIEIKSRTSDCTICQALYASLSQYQGLYMVESFNPIVLRWFAKHAPKVMRGQLSSNLLKTQPNSKWFSSFCGQYLLTNVLCRPHFIAYRYPQARRNLSFLLNAKLFKAVTAVWTIATPAAYEVCKNQYDMIIFERILAEKHSVQ